MPKIILPVRSGETFKKQAVVLDGTRFEKCRFIECQLIYAGGPADCSACEFVGNTTWNLQGPASTTMLALRAFGWTFLFGGQEAPMLTQPVQ